MAVPSPSNGPWLRLRAPTSATFAAGATGAAARMLLWAALGASPVLARQDTQLEVQSAAERGEFATAHERALAESDPLTRSRALVWLHYRARDFVAARSAAETGLALAPQDLWLAERALASALWLRDPWAASRSLERLQALLGAAPEESAAPFRASLEEARASVARLRSDTEAARGARNRSVGVAGVLLGGMALLLSVLARPGARTS